MEKIWQFFKKIFSTQPQNTDKKTEIRIINIIHNEKIKSESRDHPLKVKNSKWLSLIYLVLPAPLFFLLWFTA